MFIFDDIAYIINNVVLGDEPGFEDLMLIIGTLTAFVAFILWCCFPVVPKDEGDRLQIRYNHRTSQHTHDCPKRRQRNYDMDMMH